MKWQSKEWSCGATAVVNTLRQFNIFVDERRVIPVAGTTSPKQCKHCILTEKLISNRSCTETSFWKCSCDVCQKIRRVWRRPCDAGTDEKGILRALRQLGGEYGVTASEYHTANRNNAWQWLRGSLIDGRVVIFCIRRWSHWIVTLGINGDRIAIFDPYPSKKNLKNNGIQIFTKSELMKKWYNGCKWVRNKEKRLYAISASLGG